VPVVRTVPHGVLSWHRQGQDFSVRWFFDVDGRFYAWYANLEAPAVVWRRDVAYLDTVDWDLDIWVQPDRTWTWKDEDVFVERLAHAGAYWVDDEPRVRRAGATVVALVEAGAFPFDGTWCEFRPDAAWAGDPDRAARRLADSSACTPPSCT
jgi:protein associated with RNAse G/E